MTDLPSRVAALMEGADVAVRAPGRANLIGEHTDYNEGFVLPIALDMATYVVGRRRQELVRLTSDQESEPVEVDVATGDGPRDGWGSYVTAVVKALRDESAPLSGLEGTVSSSVPAGAGLSSSAALEIAVARAIGGDALSPVQIATVCRRAENIYVGVPSGIMDQLTSAAARAGHACLIDCRDNSMTHVPMPDGVTVVLIDSGIRRTLTTSSFADRQRECAEAASLLGAASLRDVAVDDLAGLPDPLLMRRARHVVGENQRTLDAATALQEGNLEALADLFHRSHQSYANDFGASLPEIDRLVEIAEEMPGVLGARLTGGGWGGCTVNLVRVEDAARRAEEIVARYESETGRTGSFWISGAAAGASSLL